MTVKYMGSKRVMLGNGLGELLTQERAGAGRFVDLFTGSGSVAIYIARKYKIPVLAYDLQKYSVALANAVISRQAAADWEPIWNRWHQRAKSRFIEHIPKAAKLTQEIVADFREWSSNQKLPITRAYGGHYFSPEQAVWIDALRASLPNETPDKSIALAALIHAASESAAAPGHTAQPLQPTRTAKPFLKRAWDFDIAERTKKSLKEVSAQFAKQIGSAQVGDANDAAKQLKSGDLAFIDPPYSGEHYSRFYHVLETIVDGECGEVSGTGRYPARDLRPRSKFSLKTESNDALDNLLETIAKQGAKAILTFPDHDCSNGLSGAIVRKIARKHFSVVEESVESDFSTLGGTRTDEDEDQTGRHPRQQAKELMLVLKPK
jgi:adenine-specific DNA-methyltransferase